MKNQTNDTEEISKDLYEKILEKVEEELISHSEAEDPEEAIISGLDDD